VEYNQYVFSHDQRCSICLVDYAANDTLTVLPCHPSHYFHSDCIAHYVSLGNKNCPCCRKEIQIEGDNLGLDFKSLLERQEGSAMNLESESNLLVDWE
jgi:hypothetical protein